MTKLITILSAIAVAAQQPTFKVNVDLVTTDVIVRDDRGQFVSDLKVGELEVYEDGVKQDIASLTLSHGGRIYDQLAAPAAAVNEGLIVPVNRPATAVPGRIFLIFIDDLHLDFASTPRLRQLLTDTLETLIHEGDMFGIVSTGHSSISEQLTYNRQVLESSIERIRGGGLTPQEIIQANQSSQGPAELRHRVHVAFSTANALMKNLEAVHNRRKAVLYFSSGYDFNPFAESRLAEQARRMQVETADLQTDPFVRSQQSSQALGEADLIHELAELTRAANRANATFYTIDPRGLDAGPDIAADVPVQEWSAHLRDTQDSLRTIAEGTGGFAVVNTNDFGTALTRIDNETSDYYMLGYYSKNPDPQRRTRRIEVRSTRPGMSVWSRTSYSLRPR